MSAAEHQQVADELVLRDLPGNLALLVLAAATLALGWELWGVLFQFGSPLVRPTLRSDDILGVAAFTTGWLAIVIGLLATRRRRRLGDD